MAKGVHFTEAEKNVLRAVMNRAWRRKKRQGNPYYNSGRLDPGGASGNTDAMVNPRRRRRKK